MKSTFLIAILLFSFVFSFAQCNKLREVRYYYDFSLKQLYTIKKSENTDVSQKLAKSVASKKSGNSDNSDSRKHETAPIKYKAGRDINIEVHNFNPLQYEISIESSSSTYFLSDMDKWSSQIILPSKLSTSITTTPSKTDTIVLEVLKGKKTKQIKKTSCDLIENDIQSLKSENNIIVDYMNKYKNLIIAIENLSNAYENLKGLTSLSQDQVKRELTNSFIIPLNDFLTSTSSQTLDTTSVLLYSGNLQSKEQEFYNPILEEYNKIKKIKIDDDKIDDNPKCSGYHTKFLEFRDNYDELIKEIEVFISSRTEHLALFKTNTMLYDKLKVYAISEPIMVTSAITIENDMHTILIKKKIGTADPTVYDNIHIQPARGVKIDVSPGFFFSNLSDDNFFKHSMDSIHHKNYVVGGVVRDTIVQDTYNSIYKKNNVNMSFGGMIFLHVHSQNPSNLNYGGYLGFGALFNDQARWCGSVGGTLLIGQKQRFNISAGLILSQVERLSPPYKIDTWYLETLDNIPTYRAWQAGYMLGFSWNITK